MEDPISQSTPLEYSHLEFVTGGKPISHLVSEEQNNNKIFDDEMKSVLINIGIRALFLVGIGACVGVGYLYNANRKLNNENHDLIRQNTALSEEQQRNWMTINFRGDLQRVINAIGGTVHFERKVIRNEYPGCITEDEYYICKTVSEYNPNTPNRKINESVLYMPEDWTTMRKMYESYGFNVQITE